MPGLWWDQFEHFSSFIQHVNWLYVCNTFYVWTLNFFLTSSQFSGAKGTQGSSRAINSSSVPYKPIDTCWSITLPPQHNKARMGQFNFFFPYSNSYQKINKELSLIYWKSPATNHKCYLLLYVRIWAMTMYIRHVHQYMACLEFL